MAKKSTRGRRKRQAPRKAAKQEQAASNEAAVSSDTADLADEYAYVFADLRRIAIIAAAMFVLLFALAFVLG